jgi:hypothetical protein
VSGPTKPATRRSATGGLTGARSDGPTPSLTIDDAKEAAAEAVELVKEKIGEELRPQR